MSGAHPSPPKFDYHSYSPPTGFDHTRNKQWLLSTSELADLLGLAPGTITDYGEEFSDAGFTFTRAGKRKGGEIAWRISKSKRPQ